MKKAVSPVEHDLEEIIHDLEEIPEETSPRFHSKWREDLTVEQVSEMPSHWTWSIRVGDGAEYKRLGEQEEFTSLQWDVWRNDGEIEKLFIGNQAFQADIYPDRVEYNDVQESDRAWDRASRDLAHYLESNYPLGYSPIEDKNNIFVKLEASLDGRAARLYEDIRAWYQQGLV